MPRFEYDELHTTAFRFRLDGLPVLGDDCWVLDFPRSWVAEILRFITEQRGQQRRAIPIASLNRAMRALVADVAAVGRSVGHARHPGGWLYGTLPVDLQALDPIVHAWLHTLVPSAGPQHVEELWQRLPHNELEWRRLRPDELGWPDAPSDVRADTTEATGVIAGLPRALFHLVPEMLTAKLLRQADRPEGFPRGFRRCPTSDGLGVELVSWPPLEVTDRRGNRWPYSYRLTLTVQTVAFQPEPVAHATVGIRRWCPVVPSTGGRSVSLYLLSSVPWLRGLHLSRSFRVAPVRWRKHQGTWALAWHRPVRHIFDQIAFDRPLPDPAAIGADPLSFLDGDAAAAIVYTTSAGFAHTVQAGAHARERDQIIRWVQNALDDTLQPTAPLSRIPLRFRNPSALPPQARRAALARATRGQPLAIDVCWDTEKVRDAVIDAITTDLALAPDAAEHTDGSLCWNTADPTVIIHPRPIGRLAAPLEPDASINDRQVRNRRAVAARRGEVATTLGQATGRTITIFELRGRKAFTQPGTDPKHALRLGFADSGRHSQQLTPIPDRTEGDDIEQAAAELPFRAASAWRDVCRQLVAHTEPLRVDVRSIDLPDPVDYVAVWMVRRNATRSMWARHQLPVAVWMSSDTPEVWARMLGMDTWVPYPELLLEIATTRGIDLPECDEAATARFVSDVVKSVVSDRPVLLLTCAQNLRSGWTWLRNTELQIDKIGFGASVHPITDFTGLRHVRIRTDAAHETADGYGVSDDRVGLPSGLWRVPGSTRVFASTASKPDSARRHGLPMSSRIQPRITRSGDSIIEDRKPAWNPQLVELTAAALQPGDDPVTWVVLAHALRRSADTYQDALIHPLPLHLAQNTTEYALPTTEDEADDRDEGAESDDQQE